MTGLIANGNRNNEDVVITSEEFFPEISSKAIREKFGDKTVLIVAQRISTIKHADRILVLDNGAIVGQGKHEELIEDCRVYQEILKSQSYSDGKEESL